MIRNLTCILCPRGCALTADVTAGDVSVTGNSCPKGEGYAVSECTNPVRTVTATIRVANRPDTMVSVKTAEPVPKGQMLDVMALLRRTEVQAPVALGDVLLENVCGTQIVATKAIA